jgi:hypothetical protein
MPLLAFHFGNHIDQYERKEIQNAISNFFKNLLL